MELNTWIKITIVVAVAVCKTSPNEVTPVCDKNEEVCEFTFEIGGRLSMTKSLGTDSGLFGRILIKEDGSSYLEINATHSEPLSPQGKAENSRHS